MSFMWTKKRKTPNTDPCGTPILSAYQTKHHSPQFSELSLWENFWTNCIPGLPRFLLRQQKNVVFQTKKNYRNASVHFRISWSLPNFFSIYPIPLMLRLQISKMTFSRSLRSCNLRQLEPRKRRSCIKTDFLVWEW